MKVVYSSSRGLYPYLHATINSLLQHNHDVKIVVLAEDGTLPLPCEVINVSGQKYFPHDCPNIKWEFTVMSLLRACLPDLIDDDKVICLDVDTIICDSLQPLWDIEMGENWLAWCPEYKGKYNPFNYKYYYNFGVSVMNLKQMRKDGAVNTVVRELNTNKYWCPEQDALNRYAAKDRSINIPVRYNESFCCGYTDDPAIVHFAGNPYWYESKTMFRREYLQKYL